MSSCVLLNIVLHVFLCPSQHCPPCLLVSFSTLSSMSSCVLLNIVLHVFLCPSQHCPPCLPVSFSTLSSMSSCVLNIVLHVFLCPSQYCPPCLPVSFSTLSSRSPSHSPLPTQSQLLIKHKQTSEKSQPMEFKHVAFAFVLRHFKSRAIPASNDIDIGPSIYRRRRRHIGLWHNSLVKMLVSFTVVLSVVLLQEVDGAASVAQSFMEERRQQLQLPPLQQQLQLLRQQL